MRSKATTVDAYLAAVPNERRVALARLRRSCLDHLPGYEELIAHGMPTYGRTGTPEIAFASQKNHIALYVMKPEVIDGHRAALAAAGLKFGKGCITFARPDDIPFDLVGTLLEETARSAGTPR